MTPPTIGPPGEPAGRPDRLLGNGQCSTFDRRWFLAQGGLELVKHDASTATFKGKGTDDAGQSTVTAQFVLHGYGLSDRGSAGVAADAKLVEHWKARWALLTGELKAKT